MELNFGTRISEWDRTVKTYTLSPEELEKYREGKPMFTKEKYIQLKEEGKTDKEIMATEQIDHNKLYALKKQWNLTGVKIESAPVGSKPVEEKYTMSKEEADILLSTQENAPNWEVMYNQLKKEQESLVKNFKHRMEQINALETALAEKTKAFETVVGASEKAIEENELLKREIEELKGKVINNPFASLYEKTTEENELLRELLKRYL